VVDRRYSEARRYVSRYPVNPEEEGLTPPSIPRCNDIFLRGNSEVSFRQLEYRYALANALVRRDFGRSGPSDLSSAPALALPQELRAPATQRQKRIPAAFKAEQFYAKIEASDAAMGDCLARAEPEVIRTWLVTSAGSRDEKVAVAPIGQLTSRCAIQLGQKRIGFDAENMRGPVALAYFRLATASR
jgi:hypothetical protein